MNRHLVRAFEDWTAGKRSAGLYRYGVFAKPASWLYYLSAARSSLNRRPLPRLSRARLVVVSSPLVGGVGKTPVAAYIAQACRDRGLSAAIVTLGYGRTQRGTHAIQSDRDPMLVDRVGDEAAELWRMTGIAVHVGDDPSIVIAELDQRGVAEVIVFDDGISRSWEGERRVVVLSSFDLEQPVRYLPDGRWRVPPEFVAKAACVVVTGSPATPEGVPADYRHRLASWGYEGPVACVHGRATGLAGLNGGESSNAPSDVKGRSFIFCGLGRPDRFLEHVRTAGIDCGGARFFPDHHRYRRRDIDHLQKLRERSGSSWFLTTLKDAVKIDHAWVGSTPIFWMGMRLEQTSGDDLVSVVLNDRR